VSVREQAQCLPLQVDGGVRVTDVHQGVAEVGQVQRPVRRTGRRLRDRLAQYWWRLRRITVADLGTGLQSGAQVGQVSCAVDPRQPSGPLQRPHGLVEIALRSGSHAAQPQHVAEIPEAAR
jgi:hypothetical protein